MIVAAFFDDVRYALRSLRSHRVSSAVAIASLALGIGANTAIFSLIDAVILKSLPVRNPQELVQVMMGRESYVEFTNPTWESLRDRQDVFSGIFAYGRWAFDLATGGEAHSVFGVYASGRYFETLGVKAALGRTLAPSDDTRGCAGSAVLSYGFWQREYGGRPDVLGKTISIDRHPIEIVGVAEEGFNGAEVGGSADVIVPLCAVTLIGSGYPRMLETNFYPVGWLQVIGRLKPGISAKQAAARLKVLAPGIYKSAFDRYGILREDGRNWRPEDVERYLGQTLDTYPAANGISYLRREYRNALAILMTITGMVLLIACANVANLLLARGAARQREIAIRIAVGAGRGRLIRQLLTESLLLAGAGALTGVAFAEWGARLLVRVLDASVDLSLDLRMLAFTAGVAVFTALLFGAAPAWKGASTDPQHAMKANSRGVVEGGRFGFGKALVTAQVALSLLLLVGAGLMVSTFWKLISLDAGFDPSRVLLVAVNLRSGNYPMERWSALDLELLDQLRAMPGVRSASVSSITPVCHCRWLGEVVVKGYTPKSRADPMASFSNVSAGYFETVGTPILAGRDFNRGDTSTSAKVAIVSKSMAEKYFGSANPLGQHFRVRSGTVLGAPMEIVGVVKDAKYSSLRDNLTPYVFNPWSQGGVPGPLTSFELRAAAGSPAALIRGAKAAIARVNPNLSVEFKTLTSKVDESIERERLLAALSSFFGALALVLATLGLYGVISYNVARRRNEIGIRMALGAQQSRVLGMVMGEVAVMIGIGLAIGLGASAGAARFTSAFLYGVGPNDPWTLAGSSFILALVAACAGFLPARKASRLDPMTALREE